MAAVNLERSLIIILPSPILALISRSIQSAVSVVSQTLTRTTRLARSAGAGARGRGADQVHQEAIRAGNALRQLAEKSDSRVNVHAFAEARVHQAAVERRLAGIVHGQQRCVLGIELRPEIESALLHPTS